MGIFYGYVSLLDGTPLKINMRELENLRESPAKCHNKKRFKKYTPLKMKILDPKMEVLKMIFLINCFFKGSMLVFRDVMNIPSKTSP